LPKENGDRYGMFLWSRNTKQNYTARLKARSQFCGDADEIIAMLEAQKAFYEEAVRVSSPPIKKSFIERSSAISSALEQAKAIKAKSEVSE